MTHDFLGALARAMLRYIGLGRCTFPIWECQTNSNSSGEIYWDVSLDKSCYHWLNFVVKHEKARESTRFLGLQTRTSN